MAIEYSDDISQFDWVSFDLARVIDIFRSVNLIWGHGSIFGNMAANQQKWGNNRQKWQLNILRIDLNSIGSALI